MNLLRKSLMIFLFVFCLSFFKIKVEAKLINLDVNNNSDITNKLKAAIEEAGDDDVIMIPGGDYYVSERIYIQKSNITISGINNNENKTKIICKEGTDNNWSAFLIQTTANSTGNIQNITIKDIIIDGNRTNRVTNSDVYPDGYGTGNGIGILRSDENYEIKNINISNVEIYNNPGPAVRIAGKRIANDQIVGEYEDVDRKSTDVRHYVSNVSISNCIFSNNLVGVSQNTAKNVTIKNNKINKSLHENITIDLSDYCVCEDNILGEYFGGCGSIGMDNSIGTIIRNNIIDNTNSNLGELFNTGITVNSKAGISKDITIEGNTIKNANYGIFLKDHRGYVVEQYKLSNHSEDYVTGSRPGEDFYILNNTIQNSVIYGIRVDELTGMAYLLNNNISSNQNVYADYQDIYVNEYNYKKRENQLEKINNVVIKNFDNKLRDITISKYPDKMIYSKGELLTLDGGEIDAIFDDNSLVTIPMIASAVEIAGFDSNSDGEQQLEIKFGNKMTPMTINSKSELDGEDNNSKENADVSDMAEAEVDSSAVIDVPSTANDKYMFLMMFGICLIVIASVILYKSYKED